MNLVTQIRRGHLLRWTDLGGVGLEIGPYDQPTVFKSEADVRYLDWKTRDQLVAECAHPDLVDQIPPIDYVVASNDYARYVDNIFDYVVANHVLEHAPNLIRWLQDVGSMMKDGGILFLALPDKRFSFDRFRPDTALSHFLAEYVSEVEAIPIEHLIEVEIYYDMGFIGQPMLVNERLDWARIQRAVAAGTHVGIHSHVFRSSTILDKVLRPLQYMRLIPFRIEEFIPARAETGGEMIIVLRKAVAEVDMRNDNFYCADPELPDETSALVQATPVNRNDGLITENALLAQRVAELQQQLSIVHTSHSWRLTAPLRNLLWWLR
jgi:SAM-dependent methyltransferase